MCAVYFDHNATTPLDPRVKAAMLPWFGEKHGNPSSVHTFGQSARDAVEEARERVAILVGARSAQIVFTSSGTEANNAVVLGSALEGAGGHLVISAIEHPSILAAAARLEEVGWEVSRVRPRADGRIDPEEMLAAVRTETSLVCLMLANNEVGTIQPVVEVAQGCRDLGVAVLCDAVQAVGKIPVSVLDLGVDYLTLGAHKFYGPLGAAALWIRPKAAFKALVVGGSQERRRRAGTENVPAVVGLGTAAAIAAAEIEERGSHLATLRDTFERGVKDFDAARIHGENAPRLPNTSNLAFTGVAAESLMIRLDLEGFAVSAGSACSSGKVEPSVTLTAMGIDPEEAARTIRVSFGMINNLSQVEAFLELLAHELEELRRLSPVSSRT
jgi:cysteine desulfurase